MCRGSVSGSRPARSIARLLLVFWEFWETAMQGFLCDRRIRSIPDDSSDSHFRVMCWFDFAFVGSSDNTTASIDIEIREMSWCVKLARLGLALARRSRKSGRSMVGLSSDDGLEGGCGAGAR